MRWTPGTSDKNIDDLRGASGGRMVRRGGAIGLGGLLLIGVLSLVTGQNFFALIDPSAAVVPGDQPAGQVQSSPEEERLADFVKFAFNSNQDTWHKLLPNRYQDARLVMFRDAVQSACGFAESASGPFYCPGDHRVYVDLGFYQELKERFGAPGDFAQAYVLAHEVGHHVQNITGIEGQMRRAQQSRPELANKLSVALELQADCLAGVWGYYAAQQNMLEDGDVEEGLRAAASIGDDRIQRMQSGRVFPDKFTHGSSQQRVEWFRRGLQSGDLDQCDTFGSGS